MEEEKNETPQAKDGGTADRQSILEASRRENADADLVAREAENRAARAAMIFGGEFVVVLLGICYGLYGVFNFGVLLMYCSMESVYFWAVFAKRRKPSALCSAVFFTAVSLAALVLLYLQGLGKI